MTQVAVVCSGQQKLVHHHSPRSHAENDEIVLQSLYTVITTNIHRYCQIMDQPATITCEWCDQIMYVLRSHHKKQKITVNWVPNLILAETAETGYSILDQLPKILLTKTPMFTYNFCCCITSGTHDYPIYVTGNSFTLLLFHWYLPKSFIMGI